MYLLDTDVLSALRKDKRRRDPRVATWFSSVEPADVFLSVITITEIEFGIERKRSTDRQFADRLANWLAMTLNAFGDRVLSLSPRIAYRWGRLGGRIGNLELDLAIAATALEHGLTVVTANERHFKASGVPILNPLPDSGSDGR